MPAALAASRAQNRPGGALEDRLNKICLALHLGISKVGASEEYRLLPFSKIISDRVTVNTNAGITSYFGVHGHQPVS